MASAYIIISAILIIFALVATLASSSYKQGKTSLLKEQAETSIKVLKESTDEMEKVKELSDTELDNELFDSLPRDNK